MLCCCTSLVFLYDADGITSYIQEYSSHYIPAKAKGDDLLSFCTQQNFIPIQGVKYLVKTDDNSHPFSIRQEDFQPHHQKRCNSLGELLNGIKHGRRYWDSDIEAKQLSSFERESFPSTFVPYKCDIPIYSPEQICHILNRFSYIMLIGDSLSRHTQGGLLMGLRNNVTLGSVVTSNKLMESCTCDAQFSSHPHCRKHNSMFGKFKPYQLELCPNLKISNQFESMLLGKIPEFLDVDCSSKSRGIFIVVQGGSHVKYNAQATYGRYFGSLFKNPIFQDCAQNNKVTLVWSSYTAQSESYDKTYPYQSLKAGLKFNNDMSNIFKSFGLNITTIDWLSFTTSAQHTDGLHYAAQVNYFKAQHLISIADHMWREKRIFKMPELLSETSGLHS